MNNKSNDNSNDCADNNNGNDIAVIALHHLSRLNRHLYGNSVSILDAPPSTGDPSSLAHFSWQFVQQNAPCIIRHAIDHWPALYLWKNNDYLVERIQENGNVGNAEITVTVTPNGRADAVVSVEELREHQHDWRVLLEYGDGGDVRDWQCDEPLFVTPYETRMTMRSFLDILKRQHLKRSTADAQQVELDADIGDGATADSFDDSWAYYLQQQNDNFRQDPVFRPLLQDAELEFEWANLLFQNRPDACNIWIGNDQSVTSTHKDNYENLYAVVTGCKHFTLYPPSDYHYMHIHRYRYGRFCLVEESKQWQLRVNDPAMWVPWVSVDPRALDLDRWPRYARANPIKVTVHAGEVLYLPSLWFHMVEQEPDENGKNISINMWYDMQFGPAHNYNKMLEKMSNLLDGFDLQEEEEEEEEVGE